MVGPLSTTTGARPTVTPLCACAARGEPIAAASAARARILFRMGNSFEKVFGSANGATGCQCMRLRDVPENARRIRGIFGLFSRSRELVARPVRLYPRNPVRYDPAAIRPHPTERKFMHITVAHISPILSLLAGVLILIMPRLLNLIVAIFLIINGAIGLGLLKWLHL